MNRPRCSTCFRDLTDQDLASGLCPVCGSILRPKEPSE